MTMAAMRFAGDLVRDRFGAVNTLRFCSVMSITGLLIAGLAGSSTFVIIGFAIAGIGISNMVPIAFSAAGDVRGWRRESGFPSSPPWGTPAFWWRRPPSVSLPNIRASPVSSSRCRCCMWWFCCFRGSPDMRMELGKNRRLEFCHDCGKVEALMRWVLTSRPPCFTSIARPCRKLQRPP